MSLTLATVTRAAYSPIPTTETLDIAESVPQWTSLQKLGFRLLFTVGGGMLAVTGGVVLLVTVFGSVVGFDEGHYPCERLLWLLAQIGSYLTRGRSVEITRSAGGDMLWMWCFQLGWIAVALPITALWTVMDRRRPNYRSLAASLLVFARFGLALVMIFYGWGKVIPVQMGYMALPEHQLQLTGDTSLFNVLWGFVGASEPYSVAIGLVELLSGLLLLWNRTWVLGALGSVISTAQVFLLNMTYDVPVKLVAAQLFLVAIAITCPYWPNLARVIFNRGGTRPVELWSPLWADKRWLRRAGVVAKFGIAAMLLAITGVGGVLAYIGYHTPSSTLDGVWRATSFTVDGREATLNQASPQPWVNVAITDRNKVRQLGVVPLIAITSWPSKRIVPPSSRTAGGMKPITARAASVLPEPDSPTMPTISPGKTWKETSLTTVRPEPPIFSVRPATSSRGAAVVFIASPSSLGRACRARRRRAG